MSTIDPRALRDAFGAFLTGVTVVTTHDASGAPLGFTANSFTSVSLNPPLLLVCLARTSRNFTAFTQGSRFAVNVLSQDQKDISNTFARPAEDRFAAVEWRAGPHGSPVFAGVAAWFDCSLQSVVEAGDHGILLGRIEAFLNSQTNGLGFARGGYVLPELAQKAVSAAASEADMVVGAVAACDSRVLLFEMEAGRYALPSFALVSGDNPDVLAAQLNAATGLRTMVGYIYSVYDDREVVAVSDVTLDVAKGEFMTFLGPSGSGKSTTLYALAGLQQPTSGDILLEGKSLLSVPSHKRNIGMVFQRYTLFPHLSVGDNIAFPLKVRRRPKVEIDAAVQRCLKLVRLEGFAERKPAKMSGGQQQRVALARALAYDPPVLLMDEPLSALDKKLREEIQYEIRRIHHETGVTILYVTHDQEETLRLSDRIAVFSKGVIDQVGTGAELYAHPTTRFVAEFIGDSDFLSGRIEKADGKLADIRIGEHLLMQAVPLHGAARAGDDAAIMLRPERISLSQREPARPALEATVRDITFLGNNTHVQARTRTQEEISVRVPFGHESAAGLSAGQQVWLTWDGAAAHAFCGPAS